MSRNLLALLCLWPTLAWGAVVSHGPLLGLVEPDTARIWLRTDATAAVYLETAVGLTPAVLTDCAQDYTATFVLTGLLPSSLYWYRPVVNGVPEGIKQFWTGPPIGDPTPFAFALFSDFFPAKPAPSHFSAVALGPKFAIDLGDKDHSNPAGGGLDEMRRMHRDLRGPATLYGTDFKAVFIDADPQLPNGRTWDDHDYCKNDSSERCVQKPQALQAAGEYFLFTSDSGYPLGVWHSYKYGNAEFWILDARSNRNPCTCPERSILGPVQMSWLLNGLSASTARWKFIVSPVPFHGKLDGWQGYQADRTLLVNHILLNEITGVVILSGDIHSGGAIDSGVNSFFPELSVPYANEGFAGTGGGVWDVGFVSGAAGPGFGFVEVTPDAVTLKAYSAAGVLRLSYTVIHP